MSRSRAGGAMDHTISQAWRRRVLSCSQARPSPYPVRSAVSAGLLVPCAAPDSGTLAHPGRTCQMSHPGAVVPRGSRDLPLVPGGYLHGTHASAAAPGSSVPAARRFVASGGRERGSQAVTPARPRRLARWLPDRRELVWQLMPLGSTLPPILYRPVTDNCPYFSGKVGLSALE